MASSDTQFGRGNPELKKREAQDRVLALLAQGVTVTAAMQQVGRIPNTFQKWCDREPWFMDRANSLRSRDDEASEFVTSRKLYLGFDTPWHQQKIVDAIEAAEPRSITMILLPPGAGKTSVLEDWYCLRLAEDPNYRIAVISETRDLGRKILRTVSNRMTDRSLNAAYIDQYGPFKPPDREFNAPWNADILTHVGAKSGERDYSMEVKGAGSSIFGSSFDLIVLDDIQSEKTLGKTDILLRYFRQTLYSRIMRANTTGRIVIVGTRQGPGDFYEELLSRTSSPIW